MGRQMTFVRPRISRTTMTFGPDGHLSISNVGFGPPPVGLGEILKVRLPRDAHEHDGDDDEDD
jgi:hypothetical protein